MNQMNSYLVNNIGYVCIIMYLSNLAYTILTKNVNMSDFLRSLYKVQ